jgi:hypothetical protein
MPQADNPTYQCDAYAAMAPDWELVNDLFVGTPAVAAKGEKYLPKSDAEYKDDYAVRLKYATLWEAFPRTIEGHTGMVFRKSPVFADDVPPIIGTNDRKKKTECDTENIDNAGSHFDVFTKRTFKTALIDGHSFILVDMPPPVTTDNPNATAADEIGRRPYWVHVNANQVVNWETEVVDGRTILTQVTIRECVLEKAGRFAQKEIIQYRVLTRGAWELWRKKADSATDEWEVYKSGKTTLDVIPLAPVYCNQTGYFTSQPPLRGLARMNLRHYRLQSDLDNILHVANVPMGYMIKRLIKRDAAGNELPPKIGANTWTDFDEGGGIFFAEHKGSAISGAQAEIEKTQGNMAALGLMLLSQKPTVTKTATESVQEGEAESSELAGMVRGLEDGVELALSYHAMFRGLPSGGSVAFNKDFTKIKLDPAKIQVYANMVAVGDMELEALYWMIEQAEDLPPDYDVKEAIARLKAEKDKQKAYNVEILKARPEFLPSPAAAGANGNQPTGTNAGQ